MKKLIYLIFLIITSFASSLTAQQFKAAGSDLLVGVVPRVLPWEVPLLLLQMISMLYSTILPV